jgi:hypothetical protein
VKRVVGKKERKREREREREATSAAMTSNNNNKQQKSATVIKARKWVKAAENDVENQNLHNFMKKL